MCDVCSDVLFLLENFEDRAQKGGFQMNKKEILSFVLYVSIWPQSQRQCMCCYKDFKNFEKLNSMVQVVLSAAIRLIQTLPEDFEQAQQCEELQKLQEEQKKSSEDKEKDPTGESKPDEEKSEKTEEPSETEEPSKEPDTEKEVDVEMEEAEDEADNESWSMDEKERLLHFVTKVFLMNFPSYIAYKHIVHSSLEELSQQETSALNNYCEISDPEVPLFLLRNVCFFCDTNGIGSLRQCFEKATPDTLPFTFAHILITLIANLRLWMNIPTVMQCIVPLRTAVIRYMCKLSDKDLRMAGNRNMTDLMWAAVKEPIETHFTFDNEGLDLAFKYFTCSTLTIRLAGIAQINNQITLYNECCNNETLMDAERVGHQLAQWFIENKIIEHIFGPNLHVEIIKQSQLILNFLAVEGRVTSEHIDCIWAASQLKHCSKQVYDILIPLIKNLELHPVQHLLKLVSALEPSAHTESTLYLASALIKCIWNTCTASQSHAAAIQQQAQLQASYTAIDREDEEMEQAGIGKEGKPDVSSSESIQVSEDGDHERGVHKLNHASPGTSHDPTAKSRGKSGKRIRHHAMHQHGVHRHREAGDSSFDIHSEGSHHSEESQHSEESGGEEHGCKCTHGHGQPHQHHPHPHHPGLHRGVVSGSDSEAECSESSEEMGGHHHGHGAPFHRHVINKGLARGHGQNIKHLQKFHGMHHHHRESSEEEEEEEEEMDVEEEEEEDSEYDSDVELLKQAKLIHIKHAYNRDSEESSEFDEEEARLLHETRQIQLAQQALKRHQMRQVGQQHLLQQAARLVLQRHRRQRMRRQALQLQKQKAAQKTGEVDTQDEMDTSVNQDKEVNNSADSEDKLNLTDPDTLLKETGDSEMTEANQDREKGEQQSQQDGEADTGETEVFDCKAYIKRMQTHRHRHNIQGEYIEDILSPDDGSCHSSHLSTKSEKNMADFEGEDLLSDEELAQINTHSHFNAHQMQQHLSSMASMYHTHMPHVVHHRTPQKEPALPECSDFTFDEVCKTGNTLLWDLVQEHSAFQLPDGLAMEAEKALCTLVCFSTDRKIKMKFIEACIENVAQHRSVVVSLRLLPKIFSSFQQYRSADTHAVTMWAEKELNMMTHFFIDLVHYIEAIQSGNKSTSLYCHKEQVQVRLLFLTCVFSSMGSPDGFRLNVEQVDTLWTCLAADSECSDECLSWFLNQAKSKDHHALGLDTFKYIFLEKMPQLKAESMSMTGLNLFQQLSHLARIANASFDQPLSEDQVCGMDQLWSIALRALNTDVSITAIQYLNSYYINCGNGMLEKEEEFVKRCMESLISASEEVLSRSEISLLVIQRGLVLLKNHLEAFRRRYAYHLRNWHLDGKGIVSHQGHLQEKQSSPIRIVLQPAGMTEKTQLDLMSTDLIAELRAEVARWWEVLQKQQLQRQQAEGNQGNAMLSPILGAMLGDGPIRMITLGQELTVDMDEKTLAERQFKDMQLVFVSVGASRPPRKTDGTLPSSCLPAPTSERLPMMILLQEPYFSQLLTLLELLSKLDFTAVPIETQEKWGLQTKARVLSRKVWELLMLLPTNPNMLDGFKSIITDKKAEEEESVEWSKLLDARSPHRLMYSLQIVESLSRGQKSRKKSMMRSGAGDSYESDLSIDKLDVDDDIWSKKFISKDGLRHLFSIFKSGSLQANEEEPWSQWNQECLAYLLRLISQFSVDHSDSGNNEEAFESYESPRKKLKKQKQSEKIIVPCLNQSTLDMLNVDAVLGILTKILYDAAIPGDTNQQMHTGTWGRAEVVHYSLSFLVSWAYSCDEVKMALCSFPNFEAWLKRLTLEAPEPYVRREACMGLYRLCLGRTGETKTGYSFLVPVLSNLLSFLNDAFLIKPQKIDDLENPKEKEPYGPGCRDYFWLVSRFVETISKEDATTDSESPLTLNSLIKDVSVHLLERPFYETRHGYEEDDALIGLLNLCTAIIKHNPPFKTSVEGQEFLQEVFFCLFALPSPSKRFLPKCKSQTSRSAAYDLLVELVKGSEENYTLLHSKMLEQHTKDSHTPYPWDYWPHEDGRSKCGYVGLTNLGATCYMATCMQHLYMIPQARQSVLCAKGSNYSTHEGTLLELQKMFAYLQESERKAYNPRSFCKAYTMDKQPLNTGEQKDMTEFFTDLITKLEEMSPEMKKLIKNLFGGVITNNVVSLDCSHVSRTVEEFYTVRCQVTDMKNLYESLDEVTVKDMLEGDNMYTCSKCQKKVRAEKRACFKRLPKILCFNTMRYTFNMVTMMKEKVNTHFSFPLRLNMTQYMEKNLMGEIHVDADDSSEGDSDDESEKDVDYIFELVGVTVHTGTADGGHYYSFIRDRINKTENGQDRWYLFNDAEVKPFDCSQIASECFGGEMTSKTYDSVTDKFMDFSFEKTNSAYMLFYERCPMKPKELDVELEPPQLELQQNVSFELTKDLAEWIWKDNMQFLQDKNIFEHTYFGFMWQMCGYLPTTLPREGPHQVALQAAQLSTSFVLETLIHAKEKPTMLQWIELLTKQFNSCQAACEWFLDHMAESDWWPQQILIKCPNQMVRQMFQRLLIHVITQLRPVHCDLYLQPIIESEDGEIDLSDLGSKSCITRFIRKMLTIIEHGVRPHSKYLAEYFAFLLEFAKMGDEECLFLINVNAISTMVSFYMGQKAQENYVEILSDEEEEEEVITLTDDSYKPLSLDKMIALIALLVEKSRSENNQLHLSDRDSNSIIGGKGFPFLFNQIRDNINVRQTCNLVFSLCRWNEALAVAITQMIFGAIKKLSPEHTQPFFKLLSMLVEFVGGPPGMPPFTQYVLQRFWELAKCCSQPCLDWMSTQVTRNKLANAWVLNQMESWVEPYLIAHNNVRVRNAAAFLLVSLVPSNHFRQGFRTARSILSPHKEMSMPTDAVVVLHQIYEHLLSLLSRARLYVDPQTHGTVKLTCYFTVMNYLLISKTEKLMFAHYFLDLWQLFQPKLSEPQISMHHNKQALLLFWYQVCVDCPENVKLIVTNAHVCKHIAFNYILADHDDQDVVLFNRLMLPAYFGLLRMCCQQSRSFTRQLALHQNIQWAFKNISPYPAQYTVAVEELFKMMRLMSIKYSDSSEDEIKAVTTFKRNTIQMFLHNLDARSMWQTLISAFKILIDGNEERLILIYQHGLPMITEAFCTLHVMYHEATACHVTGDIVDLLSILLPVLKLTRHCLDKKGTTSVDVKNCLLNWKERMEFSKKLLTLLNTYTPPEIRIVCIDVLKEMVMTYQGECIQTLVPILTQAHVSFQDSNMPATGPYCPRRGQKPIGPKSNIRPPRPQFHMLLHSSQIEASRGVDDDYDTALWEFFMPYHCLIDLLCRVAVNHQTLNEPIVNLSAMVAYEGVPLHSPYFAKLWYEIYHSEQVDKSCLKMLCNSSFFIDYVDAVLLDERMSLNNQHIYQFFCTFFPKVYQQVLNDQGRSLLDSLVASITAEKSALENIKSERELMTICQRVNGDLRAMLLIFSVQPPKQLNPLLMESLRYIMQVCREHQQQRVELTTGNPRQRRRTASDSPEDEQESDASEETPPKRRRLSAEDKTQTTKNNEESVSTSQNETDKPCEQTEESETKDTKSKNTEQTSSQNSEEETADRVIVEGSEVEVPEQGSSEEIHHQVESEDAGTDKQDGDDSNRKQTEDQKTEEVKQAEEVDSEPKPGTSKEGTPQPGPSGESSQRPGARDQGYKRRQSSEENSSGRDTGIEDEEKQGPSGEKAQRVGAQGGQRRDSGPEGMARRDSSSREAQRRDSSESMARHTPRERPSWVDMVAKHIESLFSIIGKK